MHVSRLFVPTLVGFLVGVFLGTLAFSGIFFALSIALFAAAILVAAFFYHAPSRYFLLAFFLIGFALGVLRIDAWKNATLDTRLIASIDHKVTLLGVVAAEPDVRENSTQLYLSLRSLTDAQGEKPANGNIILFVSRYPEHTYGDELRVEGTLKRPEAFSEDDGRVFEYPQYLAAKDIYTQMSYPHISLVRTGQGNIVMKELLKVKASYLHALARIISEPENGLLGGLILGEKALNKEWTDKFRAVGLVHVVVLSGYNMTVVADWLGVLFRFLGFYGQIFASMIGILLFAGMAGGGATVIRAAIMSMLVLLARATGRTYAVGRALLFAGVCMVALNPPILMYDPSFQLSFLASLGLLFVSPLIEARLNIFRKFKMFREILISTLSTQLIVLPLLLYQTGILSLVALPVNLLVLPLVPAAMLWGFLTGLLALLSTTLAFIPSIPAYILLWWMLTIVHFSSQLPFAALHLPPITPTILFAMYGILTAIIIYARRKWGFVPATSSDPLFPTHE